MLQVLGTAAGTLVVGATLSQPATTASAGPAGLLLSLAIAGLLRAFSLTRLFTALLGVSLLLAFTLLRLIALALSAAALLALLSG